MDWAERRRFTIGAILIAVVLVVLAIALTAVVYEAPSCVDNKQNQSETGIDCGGPCTNLCTAQQEPPVTPVPRLLRNSAGRTDLIASIENRNSDAAAKRVPYTIKLYDANLTFIKEIKGFVDLPPRSIVPLFIPGVAFGGDLGMRASLEIVASEVAWYTLATDPRVIPKVESSPPSGSSSAPRIEATLTNTSLTTLANVHVVALVRDTTSGNVIAASETVVPTIAPQGKAVATFTWNEPFASPSVRVEILPVIPLP